MGDRLLRDRFARNSGHPLCKRRHELLESRFLDHGHRSAWFDPLRRPLMGLGPNVPLPFHQKRIDFHLAPRAACFIVQLVIREEAYGLGANSPRDPASSKASRAADLAGLNPLIDHPLGTIQRLVARVVTNKISNAASWLKR
jgi:hypothetical protein